MLLVVQQKLRVIRPKDILQLPIQLVLRPQPIVFRLSHLLPFARRRFPALLGVSTLLNIVDVRQPSELLPPADGFQNRHILVIGIVAGSEGPEDVTELAFAVGVFLVLALEGL
jgi:hypothetical protein